MLSYCKKCGRIQHDIFEVKSVCDVCGSKAYEVPKKYIDKFRWRDGDGEQALIEELIKTSPEFDQYLFDHKDEILSKQSAEFNAKMEHGRAVLNEQANTPKCPTCSSTNIKKVSGTSKAISVVMFGLLSQKVKKQFHCNNCGYEW